VAVFSVDLFSKHLWEQNAKEVRQCLTVISYAPLCLKCFISDIGNSISGINIKLFADDTNFFIFNESDDVLTTDAKDKIKLQPDFAQ